VPGRDHARGDDAGGDPDGLRPDERAERKPVVAERPVEEVQIEARDAEAE